MSTPVKEKEQLSFPAFEPDGVERKHSNNNSSEEDGTLNDHDEPKPHRLHVQTSYNSGPELLQVPPHGASPLSPSQAREQSRRLDDELHMLRAERVVSSRTSEELSRTRTGIHRSKSRPAGHEEPEDDFDIGTTPVHEKAKLWQPPPHPASRLAKIFKKIHQSSFLVRWFFYIAPVTLILAMPLLVGALRFQSASVGGVQLYWFSIWLEIVWLTLWAGRLLAKCIPYPMGLASSLFTNNSKKWRDLGKQLEVPATLFFWLLAVEVSFLPTMIHHHLDGSTATKSWEVTMNKVIVSIFVCAVLNFFEKIIIQLIAISFHLRTYADRIDINKFQIGSLVKLYIYSKQKIAIEDAELEHEIQSGPASGTRTPMQLVEKAGKQAKEVFTKVGDVAGKVAGDFTGKTVVGSTHPHQVILQLLSTTTGGQVLARRLYRTFARENPETEVPDNVFSDDLRPAFESNEEADAAFTMFDRDLNGDISMDELEAVCVEIGRERKAITASLKDLDSVVSKLDDVLFFIVVVVTILVFVSLISTSASGVLTSAGSAVLALSWLFSATAQEFLQSVIFVFVKHPFDVGDRVTIYGNTGSMMRGDDYFVKEISLLFTEFKKMEGHVVQAPNSYLNNLFILNQRRSGGLAEAVPVTIKFGTTLEQIESLRNRLLEFVTSETREYQKNILTELRDVTEAYAITLNVIFFYKSNWQNELLRLQRRNKFICALMVTMQDLGIEGPRQRLAGQSPEMPMYLSNAYAGPPAQGSSDPSNPNDSNNNNTSGPGSNSGSLARPPSEDGSIRPSAPTTAIPVTHPSILRRPGDSASGRHRGESVSQMGRRVDFSLGMSSISSGADMGDVYTDLRPRLPPGLRSSERSMSPAGSRQGRGSFSRTSRDDVERPTREGGRDASSSNENVNLDLRKITSRDSGGGWSKSSMESGRMSTHRNRFFPGFAQRGGRSRLGEVGGAGAGLDMDDLEAGRYTRGDEMPNIPEASGANTPFVEGVSGVEGYGFERSQVGSGSGSHVGRLDQRTGLVSPVAVVSETSRGRGAGVGKLPRRAATDIVN